MHTIRLYHAWEETKYGIHHAFTLADPSEPPPDAAIRAWMACRFLCDPDDPNMYYDFEDLEVPESLVRRIKCGDQEKYTVSLAVDGRVDVEVSAENFEDACRKAVDLFTEVDIGDLECVEWKAVNAEASDGTFHDY